MLTDDEYYRRMEQLEQVYAGYKTLTQAASDLNMPLPLFCTWAGDYWHGVRRITPAPGAVGCPYCLRYFASRSSLAGHVSKHEGGKLTTCGRCGVALTEDNRSQNSNKPFSCKTCRSEYRKEYLSRPGKRDKTQRYGKEHRNRIKQEVFDHYGRVCVCCGEDWEEFLSIDHINGGGNQARKSMAGPLYAWLVRQGFPDGYQVLCLQCNMAKGIYGECPHIWKA